MSKRKKKRNKKYVPQEGAVPVQPVIHRYVAEDEQKRQRTKRWRRWLIVAGAILLLGLLTAELAF